MCVNTAGVLTFLPRVRTRANTLLRVNASGLDPERSCRTEQLTGQLRHVCLKEVYRQDEKAASKCPSLSVIERRSPVCQTQN